MLCFENLQPLTFIKNDSTTQVSEHTTTLLQSCKMDDFNRPLFGLSQIMNRVIFLKSIYRNLPIELIVTHFVVHANW